MNVVNVETKAQLKELYDAWAMTWEGLPIDEDQLNMVMDSCCKTGREGDIYIMSGERMNSICRLTGDNAYPDDVHIVSIKDFKGLAIFVGARWMTDIVDNNMRREGRKMRW